ncbi:MAG: hypothetical protein JWQ70_348, partial [Aeromicrobium sp.]|nr:hypothetical protein [Aeromicrobium sp.]
TGLDANAGAVFALIRTAVTQKRRTYARFMTLPGGTGG